MHDLDLILTLAVGMGAALAFGYVTQRLGLSPIVGYLLAGILVGPYSPGFVADKSLAEQVAGIGVVLLMFGVGMQFRVRELLAVRRIAIPGALVQIAVATGLGVAVGASFGWPVDAGIVFGLSLSVASTVVLLRVLADNNALHTPTGHTAVGWLVVEDLFTVLALVLLPVLFQEGATFGDAPVAVALAVAKVGLLIGIVFVAGGRVVPWLLMKIAASKSRELFTLAVLALALGVAVASNRFFGVSMELGAFLAGMIVARSEFSYRAASEALPMKDAFGVLFFVSVGMLFEPAATLAVPGITAAAVAIVLVGKPLAAFGIVLALRYPLRVALGVSMALAQIGEFSFILASLGASLGVLPPEAENALIGAAIVSISINPLLYKLIGPVEKWAGRFRRRETPASTQDGIIPTRAPLDFRSRAVVVGYGPVGMLVTRVLRENDVVPTIVDLNFDAVQALHGRGELAVYGDATQRNVLVGAGTATAQALILSSDSLLRDVEEIIRAARELNPSIRVLVRTRRLSDTDELLLAGADEAFSGEGEIALAFAESVLRSLGATPEQIDRARDRAHEELFSDSAVTARAAAD